MASGRSSKSKWRVSGRGVLPPLSLPAPPLLKAPPEATEEAKDSVQHIQDRLLMPLLKQRASGTPGALAICTLLGVGQMYGMDDCVLKVLIGVAGWCPSWVECRSCWMFDMANCRDDFGGAPYPNTKNMRHLFDIDAIAQAASVDVSRVLVLIGIC